MRQRAFLEVADRVVQTGRNRLRKIRICVLLTALLVAGISWWGMRADAQVTTGDILGTVTDSTGSAVAGAPVQIQNLGTAEVRKTQSAADGSYTFTLLQPGNYQVTVAAQGFKSYSNPSLVLAAGDRLRVDAALQIGSNTETVEVTAAPPALETDSSSVGAVVGEHAVEDLPLNNRNFIELAQTVAGANEGPPSALSGGGRPDDRRLTSSVSANGQDEYVNNQLIDGLDNNQRIKGGIGVRPSIDAIAEFSVQTNLYTAEVGRAAGAMINVITKPGTNEFHGTAYEFFRNDVMDARNFFARTGTKPSLKQNQFGGSLGGPIVHNRLFFFADYEAYRRAAGTTYTLTVPTLYEEQHVGDFSDNPSLGDVVPNANIDPIAKKYFALYPAPTGSGFSNNFTSNINGTQFTHTADARIDDVINDSNRIYFRYTINNVDTNLPGPFPTVDGVAPGGNYNNYNGTSFQRSQNAQINYLHIFKNSLVIEEKGGFTRINNNAMPLNLGTNAASSFGLTGVNTGIDTSGLTPLSPSGYASVGDGAFLPIRDVDNVFQGMSSATMIHGNHSLKAGVGLIHRQLKAAENSYGIGLFSFTKLNATQSLDGAACSVLACFLRGLPASVQRSNQLDTPNLRTWETSAYVQDDWRATRKLTLNIGVRYDFFTPFTEKHDFISNFDPQTAAVSVANQNGTSRTMGVTNDPWNAAPRVGFALIVHNGTVLRGGYGITYIPNQIGLRLAIGNPPYTFTYAPQANTTRLSAGLPVPSAQSTSSLSGALAGIDKDYRSSIIHQTNLTLEQAFGANVLSLSYVGEFGRKLRVYHNINLAAPATHGCTAPSSACYTPYLPYHAALPNVTGINMMESIGYQNYNALQATLLRRYANGLSFNANYTWAAAINDTSNFSINTSIANVVPSALATEERGWSDINVRHRIAIQANYALPFGQRKRDFVGMLERDWQVNVLHHWETGLPFSVNDSVAYSNSGVGSNGERSLQLPGTSGKLSNPTISKWFNTSAFAYQTFGTYAPMRRNSLFGPNFRQFSLSLFRTIPLSERLNMQVRAESYNLSNTPNFGQPDSNLGDVAFGQISSTRSNGNPRQLQFAVKFLY